MCLSCLNIKNLTNIFTLFSNNFSRWKKKRFEIFFRVSYGKKLILTNDLAEIEIHCDFEVSLMNFAALSSTTRIYIFERDPRSSAPDFRVEIFRKNWLLKPVLSLLFVALKQQMRRTEAYNSNTCLGYNHGIKEDTGRIFTSHLTPEHRKLPSRLCIFSRGFSLLKSQIFFSTRRI